MSDGMKLGDLKVTDLKNELEKRNLERTGVKSVLIERLQNALKEEGHDPESYVFKPASPAKNTPKRRSGAVQIENEKTPSEDTGNVTSEENSEKNDTKIDIPDTNSSNANDGIQTEEDYETEAVIKEKDPSSNVGNEPEDSINLTIGEEDEQLIDEEGENSRSKQSKVLKSLAADTPKDCIQQSHISILDVADEMKKEDEVGEEEDGNSKVTDKKKEPAEKTDKDKDTTTQIKEDGQTAEKDKDTSKGTDKDPKDKSTTGTSEEKAKDDAEDRSLWIRNLRTDTPAIDLKKLFSKYGKVERAKVVIDTQRHTPKCYGYVTMSTFEEAEIIAGLHNKLMLNGYMVNIRKATNNPLNPSSSPQKRRPDARRPDASSDTKRAETSPRPGKRSHSPDKRAPKKPAGSSLSKDKESQIKKETKSDERKKSESEKLSRKKETPTTKKEKEEKQETEKRPTIKKEEKKTGKLPTVKNEKLYTEKLLPPGIEEDEFEDSQPPVPGTEEVVICIKKPKAEPSPKTKTSEEQKKDKERDIKKEKDQKQRDREGRSRSQKSRSKSRTSSKRGGERSRDRSPKMTSRIQLEMKKLERMVREEERKRAMERERVIYRRQEEDMKRLKEERERLKYEREKIEREKAELLRMERERQALERERLIREKEEIKRQKIKMQLERQPKRIVTSPNLVVAYDSKKRKRSPPHPSSSQPDRRYERSSDKKKSKSSSNFESIKKRKTILVSRSIQKRSKTKETRHERVNKVSFRFSYRSSPPPSTYRPKEESRQDSSHSRYVIEELGSVYTRKQSPVWEANHSSMKGYSGSSNVVVVDQAPWSAASRVKHSNQSDQWMRTQNMDNKGWMASTSMNADRTVHIMLPNNHSTYNHNLHHIQTNPMTEPTNSGYGLTGPGTHNKYNQGSTPMGRRY